jgi:hypothetical protein
LSRKPAWRAKAKTGGTFVYFTELSKTKKGLPRGKPFTELYFLKLNKTITAYLAIG